MPPVKNLVLHKDMIRYLKHCDSGGDEKKVSFLETSFKASSETLGAVQGHVNNFVMMILNDLYDAYPNKNIISEKDLQEIIRKKIGFKGIIMSDDISMKALKYDLITNAKKSLLAGCNLVLYLSLIHI